MADAIPYQCPCCATPLVPSHVLHCPACKRDFPMHDEIPILRATTGAASDDAPRMRGYLDTVRADGWDAGVRRMIAEVSEASRGSELRTLMDDSRSGWRFLLAKQHGAVALEFGCGLGVVSAGLARQCAHVVACDTSVERVQLVRERARREGLSNLSYLCADGSARLPFPDGYFDFVVVNGSDESFGASRGDLAAKQRRLLREMHRVLTTDGQLYIATERDRQKTGVGTYVRTIPAQQRLLSEVGFPAARVYALLPNIRLIDQIVDLSDTTQMHTALPLYRGQSKLRQSLLRGRWHRYVAPALGVVASKQRESSRVVDRLVRHVCGSIAPAASASRATVRHYILSQKGMLILLVDGGGLELIIRVPLSPVARRHAERNAAATREVHEDDAVPADLKGRVPRPLQDGTYDGIAYFAESRIRGCEASALESAELRARAFDAAVDFAIALHGSVSPGVLEALAYERLIEENVKAVERLVAGEGYDDVFARMREYLGRALLTSNVPLVRQMGDFALSNLMIDPNDGRLVGVIDWDRARTPGLPLLDVAHLFASSSWGSMCAGDVMIKMFFAQQFDATRQKHWDRYCERMALPGVAVRPLCLAWWLDFIRGRLDTSAPLDTSWVTRNVRNVLVHARSHL